MRGPAKEVSHREYFEFRKSWQRFLARLNDDRIGQAENSFKQMLGVDNLAGRSFLDIGGGSGLFSLAGTRLGTDVHSFDIGPLSAGCTAKLIRCHFFGNAHWHVEEGLVLDAAYMKSLGKFEVVSAWT